MRAIKNKRFISILLALSMCMTPINNVKANIQDGTEDVSSNDINNGATVTTGSAVVGGGSIMIQK